ncbi:putative oxygen-independent coproporphyrinogen III oxidase [Candidatus Termititenax persephonae]|uniref:Heme chaperone HemW n=1 Tax=Candidatus Termititenax persephonae TaxID=2218525 RepID=A0A388TH02_9BACT|nr:putative oxygen-independent coproporphyrinogen III oxidase [Candidatus Termititenax persephonae]
MTAEQLARILVSLTASFQLSADCEFTVEVNPETYAREKFLAYRSLGVNRVSLGVQSFQPRYLRRLGRVSTREKIVEALRGLQSIFANVSLDLMNNLPEQTLAESAADLRTAVNYAPQHISCYELTWEAGTPLLAENLAVNELGEAMYKQTQEILAENGYVQYEISNYARPGFASRHNLAYWSEQSYLGLGLAAHSYNQDRGWRWSNTKNLADYLGKLFRREPEPEDGFNKIMLGLRKNVGIPDAYLDERQKAKARQMIAEELLIRQDNNFCLTNRGRLVLNQVLLELM